MTSIPLEGGGCSHEHGDDVLVLLLLQAEVAASELDEAGIALFDRFWKRAGVDWDMSTDEARRKVSE